LLRKQRKTLGGYFLPHPVVSVYFSCSVCLVHTARGGGDAVSPVCWPARGWQAASSGHVVSASTHHQSLAGLVPRRGQHEQFVLKLVDIIAERYMLMRAKQMVFCYL